MISYSGSGVLGCSISPVGRVLPSYAGFILTCMLFSYAGLLLRYRSVPVILMSLLVCLEVKKNQDAHECIRNRL